MTRAQLQSIFTVLYNFYLFLLHFWDNWGWLFSLIPFVKDLVNELFKLISNLMDGFYETFYWWDYKRKDPTFLDDIYHVFDYIRVGFNLYIIFAGDPGNIARLIYYPAGFINRFLSILVTIIHNLDDWYRIVTSKINDILNWDAIKGSILSWLPNLEKIADWWDSWWEAIRTKVIDWWNLENNPIRLFIKSATEGLSDLLKAWNNFWTITWPDWMSKFDVLATAWDRFWTVTWPEFTSLKWLETWWNEKSKGIQKLIEDTIKVWFPFYNDLVSLWSEIKEFFTDPPQYVYNKLDEFFERFW